MMGMVCVCVYSAVWYFTKHIMLFYYLFLCLYARHQSFFGFTFKWIVRSAILDPQKFFFSLPLSFLFKFFICWRSISHWKSMRFFLSLGYSVAFIFFLRAENESQFSDFAFFFRSFDWLIFFFFGNSILGGETDQKMIFLFWFHRIDRLIKKSFCCAIGIGL